MPKTTYRNDAGPCRPCLLSWHRRSTAHNHEVVDVIRTLFRNQVRGKGAPIPHLHPTEELTAALSGRIRPTV